MVLKRSGRQHILVVFGTRPEAIKLAPVIHRLRAEPRRFRTTVAVTAQHRQMLDQVLDAMQVSVDVDLGLMRPGQSLSSLTARAIACLDAVIRRCGPDLVLVQGDTATTLAGTLAAFYQHVPVGHVEAGLRTYDLQNPFPEEAYRRMVTLLAAWHFAPTAGALKNLLAEGVPRERIFVTGNPVVDAMRSVLRPDFQWSDIGLRMPDPGMRHVVITAHRRESFGRPLKEICRAVRELARAFPQLAFIFPVHRNPVVRRTVQAVLARPGRNVFLIDPLPYQDFVNVMARACLVISDSGGIQEEAPALGVRVVILRQVTERPEALAAGAQLVPPQQAVISRCVRSLLRLGMKSGLPPTTLFGDGRAAERIVQALAWIRKPRGPRPRDFGMRFKNHAGQLAEKCIRRGCSLKKVPGE